MTERRGPGRSLVTRRALVDIIRPAVAGSYGVTGFVAPSIADWLLGRLGLAVPGIRVSLRDGLAVDLYLTVAYGLPIAEVARQADSAVRYALGRAIGREVDRLTIHVGGLRYEPAAFPPPASPADASPPPASPGDELGAGGPVGTAASPAGSVSEGGRPR